jgi:Flp pilus assembly protein TadD
MLIAVTGANIARAGDVLKITIPRRSELTPVQRLNREGVEAVKKNEYEKAAALFYKAYLYDPADPFTLNNLGYISELQGEVDRALQFYALASEQGCTADIDRSNAKQLEGKPMMYAVNGRENGPMRMNRMNVNAMSLMSENRTFEAVVLLQEALSLDPQNPFTLNNLGVANEAIGDFDNALKYYREAADSNSLEPVVVTPGRAWRGKPISNMAGESARRLQERIRKLGPAEVQATVFTVRGVAAANKNDWPAARQNFLTAYMIDPASAFSLNNRGYVAERDGDLETAQFFYDKARRASNSNARIGSATQHTAEGKSLAIVATDSHHQVDGELDKYSAERHRRTGPIELTPRYDTPTGVSKGPKEGNPSTDPHLVSPSLESQKPQ